MLQGLSCGGALVGPLRTLQESVEEQRKGRYGGVRGGVRAIVRAGLRNSVETVKAVRTAFPTSPASSRRATFRCELAKASHSAPLVAASMVRS